MEVNIGNPLSLEEMDLPPIVYKYRSWSDQYHQAVLRERSFWFASPSTFEDQYDCKNYIRYDLLTLEDMYNYYLADSIKTNLHFGSIEQHVEYAKDWAKNSPLHDKKVIEEHQIQTHKEFCERFGVLSLTAEPELASMWKKYADNHKGFCVGINSVKAFSYFGGGGPVNYVKELPLIMPTPIHSYEKQHWLQIFHKLEEWDFEKEYRVHKFSPTPKDFNRSISLPHEAFEEVIFGPETPEAHKDEIREACKKSSLNIRFRQATLISDSISIEDLD
tara:strand:- start:2119 stop:2943 length:825 start_codon:yes stop_codon:yes gene_type:complete